MNHLGPSASITRQLGGTRQPAQVTALVSSGGYLRRAHSFALGSSPRNPAQQAASRRSSGGVPARGHSPASSVFGQAFRWIRPHCWQDVDFTSPDRTGSMDLLGMGVLDFALERGRILQQLGYRYHPSFDEHGVEGQLQTRHKR